MHWAVLYVLVGLSAVDARLLLLFELLGESALPAHDVSVADFNRFLRLASTVATTPTAPTAVVSLASSEHLLVKQLGLAADLGLLRVSKELTLLLNVDHDTAKVFLAGRASFFAPTVELDGGGLDTIGNFQLLCRHLGRVCLVDVGCADVLGAGTYWC